MEVAYAYIARCADISSDGAISAIGADFDTLVAPVFPCMSPLALVIKLQGAETSVSEVVMLMQIMDPDGKPVSEEPMLAVLNMKPSYANPNNRKSKGTTKIVVNFLGPPLPKAGEYQVHLSFTAKLENNVEHRLEKTLLMFVEGSP